MDSHEHGYDVHPDDSRTAHATVVTAPERGASEPNYLTQLRQLLTDHFDVEELRTLCFDRGMEYDDLGGEGRADKARELVAYSDRHGRIPELVDKISKQRPEIAQKIKSAAIPSATSVTEFGQGLSALVELMKSPKVREAVATFHADFKAASEQINVMGDYKQLHDWLHTLQFNCYDLVVQEARRFPDDEAALDNLADYEKSLQLIVSNLKKVAGRTTLSTAETLWIEDLVKAREALAQAIEKSDAALLKKTIRLLNRVIAVQPSQINAHLNAAAKALRLPALVDAMTRVRDQLANVAGLDAARVSQFETGVDALVMLNPRLATLVSDHGRWQALDLELRRIDATLGLDLDELLTSWPDVRAMAEPLCCGSTDESIISFCKESDSLDSALTAADPTLVKRRFKSYFRQASMCFFQVDTNLREQSDDLRKVRDPLASVIEMIK